MPLAKLRMSGTLFSVDIISSHTLSQYITDKQIKTYVRTKINKFSIEDFSHLLLHKCLMIYHTSGVESMRSLLLLDKELVLLATVVTVTVLFIPKIFEW